MGNQQCNQCRQSYHQNQAYGTHQLLKEDSEVYAVVEKIVDSNDYKLRQTVRDQLEVRKYLDFSHIARLYGYRIEDQSYGFKATMKYQYIPKTLRTRMAELKSKNQQFSERELFTLIYNIESALQELSRHNIKHNCINMETIVSKSNLFKLTDVSTTTYITSYDLVIKGNRQQFLSERILDGIYNMCLCPNYELKDDYFSLGMIVVAIAVGKDARHFYGWDQKGCGWLNVSHLEASIKDMQRKYSSKLVKKIKWLLYQAENCPSEDETNLTSDLIHLDQQMNRVMNKAKKICSGTRTNHETTVCSPEKTLKKRIHSLYTSPHIQ